jgi:DNA repair exonuclease SbcCD nuclease subunit
MSVSIILGDPHIGKGLSIGKPGIGSALNSRIVDQLNILEWTLDRAIEYMASNIIITGDVFQDSKPHPTIIALFVSWLKKCTDNGLDVHIIAGNHDILRSGQFYMSALDIISAAEIEGVYVYKHMSTLHTPAASYTFIPYRDRRSFNTDSNAEAMQIIRAAVPYELASIDAANAKVVVGHLSIEGSIPVGDEFDDLANELFCPVEMFKGYDFTWMGHVHKPQILSKAPYVSHIGSMDLSDFGETDHTKLVVVFDPKKSEPFKYLEIPSRPLKQISVAVPPSDVSTTDYVVNELKSKHTDLSKAIVNLNITLGGPELVAVDRSQVEKCLIDLGSFHISRISEEKKVAAIKKNSTTEVISSTVNEFTAIKMYADTNVDAKIRNDFVSLATSIAKECAPEMKDK